MPQLVAVASLPKPTQDANELAHPQFRMPQLVAVASLPKPTQDANELAHPQFRMPQLVAVASLPKPTQDANELAHPQKCPLVKGRRLHLSKNPIPVIIIPMPAHRTPSTSAIHNPQSTIRNPLIVVTNDDGITSPGLWAAARAALPLGQVLVVAPDRQWSGAGRSMPPGPEGRISRYPLEVEMNLPPSQGGLGGVTAYQVDASPALAVLHAVLGLAPRRPALLISGINYGENLGADVTISGTVGAALQAAALGIPALAVSLQTPKETHINPSDSVDFGAAIHFTRLFARRLLATPLPSDVDLLKLDVPSNATPETPWRLTRVSRYAYFTPIPPQRVSLADPAPIDYLPLAHPERTEPDSDVYALAVDRIVSVAPLSLDLTSRAGPGEVEALLRGPA